MPDGDFTGRGSASVKRRRLILLGVFFLVAAGLAFYVQNIVMAALFVPISYIWWGITILYHSVAQILYWILLLVGVALMAFGSLYGKGWGRKLVPEESIPPKGPLESTAGQISRAGGGIYYKWLIANRMGKLARSILNHRNGEEVGPGSPLTGRDWDPPTEVESYLEAGLTRTFADFPRQKRFSPPPVTPFDVDLNQVIKYLESQMENQRD